MQSLIIHELGLGLELDSISYHYITQIRGFDKLFFLFSIRIVLKSLDFFVMSCIIFMSQTTEYIIMSRRRRRRTNQKKKKRMRQHSQFTIYSLRYKIESHKKNHQYERICRTVLSCWLLVYECILTVNNVFYSFCMFGLFGRSVVKIQTHEKDEKKKNLVYNTLQTNEMKKKKSAERLYYPHNPHTVYFNLFTFTLQ